MSKQLRPCCPDCGAAIGERHRAGCDIERCYHCGWQALGCLHFDPNDARRQAWNAKWPGEEDCERLDFFVNGDCRLSRSESVVRGLRLGCRAWGRWERRQ